MRTLTGGYLRDRRGAAGHFAAGGVEWSCSVSNMVELFRRTFKLIPPGRTWRWYLIGGFSLSLAVVEATGAALIYLLVSLIASPEATVAFPVVGDLAARFPERSSRELRAGAAIIVAVFFVLRAVYLLLQRYLEGRIIANAGAVIASDLLDGYLELPYLFHTQRSSSELMRNTVKAAKILTGILTPMIAIISKLVVSTTLIGTLLFLSPTIMAAATLLLGTTVLLIQRVVRPRIIVLARRTEEATKQSFAAIQQSLGGIRDIKLLRREKAFADLHRRQQLILARNNYLDAFLSNLSPLAIETALMLTIVTVFVLTTAGAAGGQAALPLLAVFAYVGLRLQPVLQDLVRHLNKIAASIPFLEFIEIDRHIVDEWRSDLALERKSQGSVPTGKSFTDTISVRDVSFSYGPEAPEVLTGIDLTIRRGDFIGICGPTGGGKSTLADLLVGLLQPTSGAITVDGVDLGFRPLWWWQQVGVVSQSVFLTDDTLRSNIAFGSQAGKIDEDRLARCVARAQLTSVIAQLPEGIDTFVGERGIRLSGGQRQRVAIARAMYREPDVLVLDEGTSALDGATERALVTAIDESAHGRTLIAIAHRISTIRSADRIYVVADGRIRDHGTYDELLVRDELFQSLT